MSATLHHPRMTREEFLAWDATQDGKWEYDGWGPVAMTGGTRAHAAIARNLLVELTLALRGRRCEPFGGDLRIDTGATYRFPDAVVSCTPGRNRDVAVCDPVTVFEVLSPNTALTDMNSKNFEYRAVASIQRYVMLDQDRTAATVFVRLDEDWVGRIVEGADAVLDLPEIDVRLRLGDLYVGVDLG